MKRREVLWLALGTLVILGGLGLILTPLARDISLYTFFQGHQPFYVQVALGLLSGLAIAMIAWELLCISYLARIKAFFKEIIGGLKLNTAQVLLVSICAGAGEELLFRGAVQPFAGLIVTSVVFVALHGYLNPFHRRMIVYGSFMTLSIIYIGYLTETVGILSSVIAHTVVDIYLLKKISD